MAGGNEVLYSLKAPREKLPRQKLARAGFGDSGRAKGLQLLFAFVYLWVLTLRDSRKKHQAREHKR
eukprot:5682308-Amphidinium_carterae.1